MSFSCTDCYFIYLTMPKNLVNFTTVFTDYFIFSIIDLLSHPYEITKHVRGVQVHTGMNVLWIQNHYLLLLQSYFPLLMFCTLMACLQCDRFPESDFPLKSLFPFFTWCHCFLSVIWVWAAFLNPICHLSNALHINRKTKSVKQHCETKRQVYIILQEV